MYQQNQSDRLNKAYTILDDMFTWDDNVAQQSKRHKAVITVLGQKKKPGGSMAVILDQGKLLTKAVYKDSENIKGFVNFLGEFAGL